KAKLPRPRPKAKPPRRRRLSNEQPIPSFETGAGHRARCVLGRLVMRKGRDAPPPEGSGGGGALMVSLSNHEVENADARLHPRSAVDRLRRSPWGQRRTASVLDRAARRCRWRRPVCAGRGGV